MRSTSFPVVILDFKPMPERRFTQWSMAYIGHEVLAAKKFMQIQKESGFDVGRLSGDRIYDLPQMHLYATQQENTIKVD